MLLMFHDLGKAIVSDIHVRPGRVRHCLARLEKEWKPLITAEIKDKMKQLAHLSTFARPEELTMSAFLLASELEEEIYKKVGKRAYELTSAIGVGLSPWDFKHVEKLHNALRLRDIEIPEELEEKFKHISVTRDPTAIHMYLKVTDKVYSEWLKEQIKPKVVFIEGKEEEKGEEEETEGEAEGVGESGSENPIIPWRKPKPIKEAERLLKEMKDALKAKAWDELEFFHEKFGKLIPTLKGVV